MFLDPINKKPDELCRDDDDDVSKNDVFCVAFFVGFLSSAVLL